MKVLGIDPGSRWIGWCCLDGARLHAQGVLEIGAEAWATRGIVRELRRLADAHRVDVVAIERVEQVNHRPGFGPKMATDLVAAAHVGARLAQGCEDDGRTVIEVTAEAWHMHFFDRRAVDAQAVKALVEGRVTGWPKVSNGHARDAAAVALYAPIAARRAA